MWKLSFHTRKSGEIMIFFAVTSFNQKPQDVWKKTSNLRHLKDVWFTTSWGRLIYDVLKTSNLRLLEDVCKMKPWRRPIYVVMRTSNLQRLVYDILRKSDLQHLIGLQFTSSWRRLIYDVFKTSVKRSPCSNVVATSVQRQKKWFFFILYCLKYSDNSCLG